MTQKTLLSVVGPATSPRLQALYRSLDFNVVSATSTRKALSYLKQQPEIIVAEFLFSPTYGSQLSNFEALFAGVQRDAPHAKIIALYEPKDQAHLLKVSERQPLYDRFAFPVNEKALRDCLQQLIDNESSLP